MTTTTTTTKSANVKLLEALKNFYLETNYSPNPITCMNKASETLLQVVENKLTPQMITDKLDEAINFYIGEQNKFNNINSLWTSLHDKEMAIQAVLEWLETYGYTPTR